MTPNQEPPKEFASDRRTATRKRLALSAVIGLLSIGTLVVLSHLNFESTSATTISTVATPTDVAPMDASPSLGPQNAPVTIVEYGDLGCQSCWVWHKLGVLNELRAKYGDQIRFVWRDFPVITLLSPKAAEAGQCAYEQGKFWEFHDAALDHQGAIEAGDLLAYAGKIGLNIDQFTECVTSRRFRDRVNVEQQESFDLGLTGTPEFVINGKWLVKGPQRLPVFEGVIDPLLAAKK